MLEIKSIYLNRNKKQILSNFNLILKKKNNDFTFWERMELENQVYWIQ